MAEELTIDNLTQMTASDFMKAFKKKSAWNKARAVIIMVDFRLSDGKKKTVAIPYRKESEMKSEMQKIKNKKLHSTSKTGGGLFSEVVPGRVAIELKLGGLSPDIVYTETSRLFSNIDITLGDIQIAEDAQMKKELTEDQIFEEAYKRTARLTALIKSIDLLEKSLASFTPNKALEMIEKYQSMLTEIEEETVFHEGYGAPMLEQINENFTRLKALTTKAAALPVEPDATIAVELTTNMKSILGKIQALPADDPQSETTKKALMAELNGHYTKLCIFQKGNANALKNLPNDLKKAAMDGQKLINEAKNAQ